MNKKYVTTKKRPVERSRFHDFLVEISISKWRLAADGKDGVFKKISLVFLFPTAPPSLPPRHRPTANLKIQTKMVAARYFSFSFFRKKKVLTQADIFSRPFLNNVFFFYILNCKYKKKVCHLPINSRQKVKRLTLCPPQMLYRIVCDKVGSSLIIRV